MNGRMYDPRLARFLSPDPFVQAPDFSQSFNRYSYCVNNPLKYTDPTGEFWHLIIGGIIGGIQGYRIGKANGAKGWAMFGYIAGGAAIGTLAGHVGFSTFQTGMAAGVSTGYSGFSLGFNAGLLSGAASGAISGAGFTALQGGSFADVLGGATIGAWMGGVTGGILGGLSEGIRAHKSGLDFWGRDIRKAYNEIAISKFPTNPDGTLVPSNKTLDDFSEKYFSKFKYRDKAYLHYENGYVEFVKPDAAAFTRRIPGGNGNYNIFFGKTAFDSKWELFMIMGHEYVHVANLLELGDAFIQNFSELAAYTWNYRLSGQKGWLDLGHGYFNPELSPRNYSVYKQIVIKKYMLYDSWNLPMIVPFNPW